jgi:hypothetical protein
MSVKINTIMAQAITATAQTILPLQTPYELS